MTGNKIANTGGMFFAAMLQINSSLEKLDLGDCDLVSQFMPWVLLPGEQHKKLEDGFLLVCSRAKVSSCSPSQLEFRVLLSLSPKGWNCMHILLP